MNRIVDVANRRCAQGSRARTTLQMPGCSDSCAAHNTRLCALSLELHALLAGLGIALAGVDVKVLLESSVSHGGSLSVDPVATMRKHVPVAALFAWTDRAAPFADGKVHAKVAVADGEIAFLTSANLTGHALEKNMEAGVVIDGGKIPQDLRAHLEALIGTKVIRKL